MMDSIFEFTLSKTQYFSAKPRNSSELSTVVILPFGGNPRAIKRVLKPVNLPISKQFIAWEI